MIIQIICHTFVQNLYKFVMKTDIEIARETVLQPIETVAGKIGIPNECLEHYGKYIAKVPESLANDE